MYEFIPNLNCFEPLMQIVEVNLRVYLKTDWFAACLRDFINDSAAINLKGEIIRPLHSQKVLKDKKEDYSHQR